MTTSTVYDLYDIYTPQDICQTPQDMIQTPLKTHRHHPDTPQTKAFYVLEGTGRKGNMNLIHFTNIFGINTSPDTLRPHPDTLRIQEIKKLQDILGIQEILEFQEIDLKCIYVTFYLSASNPHSLFSVQLFVIFLNV